MGQCVTLELLSANHLAFGIHTLFPIRIRSDEQLQSDNCNCQTKYFIFVSI